MLRRVGYTGKVTLIGADDSVPYDRPNLSKDYLAGDAPEDWIPLRSPEFYSEHDIELVQGVTVESVDAGKRTVELATGESIPFDKLLLATGAEDHPRAFQHRVSAIRRAPCSANDSETTSGPKPRIDSHQAQFPPHLIIASGRSRHAFGRRPRCFRPLHSERDQ
jgi:hypothetical protein